MGGARKFDHLTPIIQKPGWLKVIEKHKFDKCTVVFKILNGFYPAWYKKFLTVQEARNSTTRQQRCLFVAMTRTDTGARRLDVTGPTAWNTLSTGVTNAISVLAFKSRLTSHILK